VTEDDVCDCGTCDVDACDRCGRLIAFLDDEHTAWCRRCWDDQEPTVAQLERMTYGYWWA